MTIHYYKRNVYGNPLIYLIEDENSDTILSIINQKTIHPHQMRAFAKLGIEFNQVIDPQEGDL